MKILFAGDIVLNKDKFTLSEELLQVFDQSDVKICNMEAVIANPAMDNPIIKCGPAIYQSDIILNQLNKYDICYASIANNHILDYGANALSKTIESLSRHNITSFGAGLSFDDAYAPVIIQIGNKKISIIAGSQAEFGVYKSREDSFGYAWINHPEINNIVRKAKETSDFVFIMPHAGLENVPYPLPEWRSRYKELIDCGADCIIGSHPHIVQGYEVYNDKYIFYSLGNFFFELPNVRNSQEGNKGIIIVANIEDSITFEVIPFCVENRIISIDHSEETKKRLKERSDIFNDEKSYLSRVDLIASDLWEEYYGSYYIWSSNMNLKTCCKNLVKSIVNRIIKKKYILNPELKIDTTLLLHNIQIETHRWVVERFLYNQNKKVNKFTNK